jgi:hypothetical protein
MNASSGSYPDWSGEKKHFKTFFSDGGERDVCYTINNEESTESPESTDKLCHVSKSFSE